MKPDIFVKLMFSMLLLFVYLVFVYVCKTFLHGATLCLNNSASDRNSKVQFPTLGSTDTFTQWELITLMMEAISISEAPDKLY
jgi:hypothetical protein